MTRRELYWAALAGTLGVRDAVSASASSARDTPLAASSASPLPAGWRADFPALDQSIDGQPLVYLDSAATTQRPTQVIDAIVRYYRHDNANPGGALHALARRAFERYEEARAIVARFIGARSPQEVVWVRGTTEGVNLVAQAWARPRLRAGDEILLTIAEHASNLLPWQLVAEQTGAALRFADVDEAGRIALEDFERKLSSRTRLAAFSHVSNVAGYVNPAATLCQLARRAGARVFIDAAQSAPHVPLDVQALNCDFLAFSAHKMLGPMGVGVLWARSDLLEEMVPYQAGSNMAHDVDVDGRVLESAARKFGAGTPNVSGPIGLAAAVRYIEALGRSAIERYEESLTRHALARLSEVRGLRLIGPDTPEQRIPVFAFTLADRSPRDILRALDARGIAVRAGDLSALPLLKRFGVTAAARASCYLYSSRTEIDALAGALSSLA